MCNRRRNLRDIASEVGISFGVVQSILTDSLGISKVSARWVLRILTEDQKRSRLDISTYFSVEEFMDRVVTQVETWVHHFDPESEKQPWLTHS